MAKQKKALGKGLEALFASAGDSKPTMEKEEGETGKNTLLSVDELVPSSFQPRQNIKDESLLSLADSIREHGLLQPIIVRRINDRYEIVAGERRWRAAKLAGLAEVPVVIVDLSDSESLEVALVENLQREDLSSVEVARSLFELTRRFGLTHEEMASRLGWSRPAVTNKLRLLDLPSQVQDMLDKGELSEGHARVLLGINSSDDQILLAKRAAERSWSVRRLEEEVGKLKQNETAKQKRSSSVKLPIGESMGLRVLLKRSNDETRLIIGGLDDSKANKLIDLLKNHLETLFDED